MTLIIYYISGWWNLWLSRLYAFNIFTELMENILYVSLDFIKIPVSRSPANMTFDKKLRDLYKISRRPKVS